MQLGYCATGKHVKEEGECQSLLPLSMLFERSSGRISPVVLKLGVLSPQLKNTETPKLDTVRWFAVLVSYLLITCSRDISD